MYLNFTYWAGALRTVLGCYCHRLNCQRCDLHGTERHYEFCIYLSGTVYVCMHVCIYSLILV